MQRVLLDTSAWRAFSNQDLAHAAVDTRLFASPYSFWEVLTHLDECSFTRSKGQLLKFWRAEFLDDPWAGVLPSEGKLPDVDIIHPLLAALRESESIERLYRCAIRDSRGDLRQVDGIVARTEEILRVKEHRFVAYQEQITKLLGSGGLSLDGDQNLYQATQDVVRSFRAPPRVDPPAGEPDPVADQTYVYSMYVVMLAQQAAAPEGKRAVPNDYEDSSLLLHFDRRADWLFVAKDKPLAALLAEGLAHWERLGDTLPPCRLSISAELPSPAA